MCPAALALALVGALAGAQAAPCPPTADAIRAVEQARAAGQAASAAGAWRALGGATRWRTLGPLPGGLDPPPPAVDEALGGRFEAAWPGVEGRLTWQAPRAPVAPVPAAEGGVHLLAATLPASVTPRAVLRVGSSGAFVLWVDGRLLATGPGGALAYDAVEVALPDSAAPRRLVALVEAGRTPGGFAARVPQAAACPEPLPPPGVPAWTPPPAPVIAAPPAASVPLGAVGAPASWWVAPGEAGFIVMGWRAGRPTTAAALAALPEARVDVDAPGDLRLRLPAAEGWPLEPLPLALPCPAAAEAGPLQLGPPTVAWARVDWAGPPPRAVWLGGPFGVYRRTVRPTADGWWIERELRRSARRVEPAERGAYRRWCRAVHAAARERMPSAP